MNASTYRRLSYPQRGMWLLEKQFPGTSMWTISSTVRFNEPVDFGQLEQAIHAVIESADALRLSFREDQGELLQCASLHEPEHLERQDFSAEGRKSEMESWIQARAESPMDVSHGKCCEFVLLTFEDGSRGYFFRAHHMAIDGTSWALLLRQIRETLKRLQANDPNWRPRPATSCLAYLDVEDRYLESEDRKRDGEFWHKMFETIPDMVELAPLGHSESLKIRREVFRVPSVLGRQVYRFCDQHKASVFRLFFAALATYVLRATGRDDFVIGIGSDNRHGAPQFRDSIGMFVQVVPVRMQLQGDATFSMLLGQVRDQLRGALSAQRYTYGSLLTDLMQQTPALSGLMNIAIVQHPGSLTPPELEVRLQCPGDAPYDLMVYVQYDAESFAPIELSFDYREDLFSGLEIEALQRHLINIVRDAVAYPNRSLARLELLSDGERKQIVECFNATTTEYPKQRTVVEEFEEQVECRPHAVAVRHRDKILTYFEVNQRANRIARVLTQSGAGPGSYVGILTDRSAKMVPGLLGILKTGAAFVPIDADYPEERIRHILQDSGARVLLTRRHLAAKASFPGVVVLMEDVTEGQGVEPNPELRSNPEMAAYMIYTSGSTGKPKGVAIRHRSLQNLCWWSRDFKSLSRHDRIGKFAAFGFDASVWEIFQTLFVGASLHIIPDDVRLSPLQVRDYFDEHQITVAFLPTQFCEQFLELPEPRGLRWLDAGGDRLRRAVRKGYTLANCYGPTEYTVATTASIVREDCATIPIGRPLANTRVYILDRFGNPQPVGAAGELCVAGDGIGLGYHHQPKLTADKFVADPFLPGESMYRTGDLARWQSDGQIEFLGRIDQQVKIRGFRVELGEIEQVMLQVPTVREAAVVDRTDSDGGVYLSGYYVSDKPLIEAELRQTLAKELPIYMVPEHLIWMQRIPLTPNGKVDRKALPEPDRDVAPASTMRIAPRNEIESMLGDIWKEILSVSHVGIDDSFFALGGHSLKAAMLQARVQQATGCMLSLRQIFAAPTVRQLAEQVAKVCGTAVRRPAAPEPIRVLVQEKEHEPEWIDLPPPSSPFTRFPLSHSQKRQVVSERMNPGTLFGSLPFTVRMDGEVDFALLERAILATIRRFDCLRLRMLERGGDLVQRAMHKWTRPVELVDFVDDPTGARYQRWREARARVPFELVDADLCDFAMVRWAGGSGGFYMNLHHIIFDGWTLRLVVDTIQDNYRRLKANLPLDETLAPSYTEYVDGELAYLKSQKAVQDRDFWVEYLSQSTEQVLLPFNRAFGYDARSSARWYDLSGEQAKRIQDFCEREHISAYGLFMGALAAWVHRVTWIDEVTLGVVSHSRATERERQTAGMCVNSFPLMASVRPEMRMVDVVRDVQDQLRHILKNHGRYPFDLALQALRERGRNAPNAMNVIFVGHDWPQRDGVEVDYHQTGFEQPPFHLIVNLALSKTSRDYMKLWLVHPVGMYTEDDVQAIYRDLMKVVMATVEDTSQTVSGVRLPSVEQGLISRQRTVYPLSSAQKRVFLVEQMTGVGTTYNIPVMLEIDGPLDSCRLLDAVEQLIRRHDALRTSLEIVGGEPVQRVHEEVRHQLTHHTAREEDLSKVFDDFVRPFVLSSAPLFRVALVKVSDGKHFLLLDFHHTVFDGTSLYFFLHELRELYRGGELEPVGRSYPEFAVWEQRMLRSECARKMEEFWLRSFAGPLPVLDLPTDFPRPPVMDYRGQSATFSLSADLTQGVTALARQAGATPYMVLMAALNVLLARYCSQEDVVVGAGMAGRNAPGFEQTVGMFIQTLPIRSCPKQAVRFIDFLRDTRDRLLEIYDNQDYPFERLVEKLNIKRDTSRAPLFDVAFVLQNQGLPDGLEAGGVSFLRREAEIHVSRADLMLDAQEREGRLRLRWEYRTSLFTRPTIERLNGHFRNILEAVRAQPETLIGEIRLLSADEQGMLVDRFNKTEAHYPREQTVHELFEAIAGRFSERVAVTFGDRQVTYRELNARANQLAHRLRASGIHAGSIVALMVDRCPEMIVGMLGIMKAGGCYLPIKPDYPIDRIGFMLQDSKAPVLVTSLELRGQAPTFRGEVIDIFDKSLCGYEASNPKSDTGPEDLVYIIYTSGSTGRPKGVMLEHRNVVRLFLNERFGRAGYYSFDENDVWSMFHSFCFDFSVWEMYGALLYGGRLVIVPKETTVDPAGFLAMLKKEKVTVVSQTPGAFYNLIAEDLKSDDRDLCLRYVTFGGEALKPAMLGDWHRKYANTKLINMYGITETTVHVTYKEITEQEIETNRSNIGAPIPTLTTYIMDRDLKLVPIGVPGEICVGGDGLARGYLGQPERTAERFVANPYRRGDRLYRSGDLARMLPCGEMEYLGRIDFQVKVRGFRVELGEIENCLLRNPAVEKAVVVARDDREGNKYIVAYLTMSEDTPTNTLREYLLRDLPDYMVPAYFLKLPHIPLTPNGKVDRNALPEPGETVDTGVAFVAPRNETESKIAEAWGKTLGLDRISVLDNFFALGGHSLKAVAAVAELQKHFDVTINDIFRYQTVARLAENLRPIGNNLQTRLAEIKRLIPARRASLNSGDLEAYLSKYRARNERYAGLDVTKVRAHRTVLLTGATGYLGAHLLHELLAETDAGVWAIVRAPSRAEAGDRLRGVLDYYFGADYLDRNLGRVRVLCGDLTDEKLGLNEGTWDELARMVDGIVHAAALVKHYGHRSEFELANVASTRNLLRLAETGARKTFHHVSTLSVVVGRAPGKQHLIFSEDDADVGQQSDNHYVATKLQAELAVMEAQKRGLVAHIYRVGNISINSRTGLLQRNIEGNAFFQRVRALVNLSAVAEVDDEAEVSFVDSLAKAIVLLMRCGGLESEVFHLLNPHWVRLSELLASPILGMNVRRLPLDGFVDFLAEHYDVAGFKEHIHNYLLHSGWTGLLSTKPGAESEVTPFTLLSERTQGICERLGFRWPEVEPAIFGKMIDAAFGERCSLMLSKPVFAGLDTDTVSKAARLAVMNWFSEAQELAVEGATSADLRFIVDGRVELLKRSNSGWLGAIGELAAGDFLGEESMLDGDTGLPAPVTARAAHGGTRVLTFPGSQLRQLMGTHPMLALRLMRGMSERQRRAWQ